MHTLKYNAPARRWREALPLGNGFCGIMIYGSLKKERLCFNDGTLWSGYPKSYDSEKSLKALSQVRKLIFEGKNAEADALCEEQMSGFYSESFLPLCELEINFRKIKPALFSRELDLFKGLHTVTSRECTSEAFSSYPDKISAYRVKSKKPFSAELKLKSKLKYEVKTEDNAVFIMGNAPDYVAPNYLRTELFPVKYNEKKGMAFCLEALVETNGKKTPLKSGMRIENATEITLYFVTATGFSGFDKMADTKREPQKAKCKAALNNAELNFEALKARHIADFSKLITKQSVSFGHEYAGFTDSLLKSVKAGGDEKALCELLYNYGKYLTVSGSRKGSEALNLQGIWNNSVRPPWSSNYTVNINTQMNYWGASRASLSSCIEPLIRLTEEVMINGEKTAQKNYGCRGFACNHNVDIWRKTPPVKGDASYMFAPLCGVWLANEVYLHFKNGELCEYKERIEKIVSSAAAFASDFLVMHDGHFTVCPSTSPENKFVLNGKKCKLDFSSAFDLGLVRQAFKNALEISKNAELKSEIEKKLALLAPFKEGRNGILEWHADFDTPEPGHRHFSPLYAFYPGNVLGYYENEELKNAVLKLFKFRTDNSKQYIGWSAAWAVCLASRLREPERVAFIIRNMLSHSVFENLFCVHPPFLFQIDGNLGFVAGINEMLLSEENGKIELLPALPKSFKRTGEVKNMTVGGAKISFKWQNGEVTEITCDKKSEFLNKHISKDAFFCENVLINP